MPSRRLAPLSGIGLLLWAPPVLAQCGALCLYEIGTPDSAHAAKIPPDEYVSKIDSRIEEIRETCGSD